MKKPINIIQGFAVVCVAVTSAFVMWMSYTLLQTLSGPTWCSRAIGADQAAGKGNIDVAASCVSLLTIQLKSLANNSYIFGGVVALCLLTLIVIVIAGGHVSFKGPAGISGDINTGAPQAAQTVADAAQDTADQIKEVTP